MPQETKAHPDFDSPTGVFSAHPESLAGWTVDLAAEAGTTMDVLEKAFDYRGDVTLHLADGRAVSGYLFDRRRGAGLADSTVRLMPAEAAPGGGNQKIGVRYSDIRRIEFSARDPAAGKSFETWVKKYIEKKTKGEVASIESESLD
ncbi:MAG: hypothetical protein KF745_15095 [Phycisphaeraceae bacterium]|nr:hypothetical protein [Phycisphaeraceae bacterium]